jgi:hypothetical protein
MNSRRCRAQGESKDQNRRYPPRAPLLRELGKARPYIGESTRCLLRGRPRSETVVALRHTRCRTVGAYYPMHDAKLYLGQLALTVVKTDAWQRSQRSQQPGAVIALYRGRPRPHWLLLFVQDPNHPPAPTFQFANSRLLSHPTGPDPNCRLTQHRNL